MSNVRARRLSPDEARQLSAARLVALDQAPYLAHAIFSMDVVAAEGLGTMAVDARWRCYVDPAVLAEWGAQLSGVVLVHEVWHLLRHHADRADAIGCDVDHSIWNIAADAAINDDLIDAGMALPEGVVTPAGLDLPDHGIEEAYYAALLSTLPPADIPDEPGCGSGAGEPATPWELPNGVPMAPGLSPAAAEVIRRAVADEVRGSAPGTLPAGLRRWADDTLAPPTVPWQQILGSAVRRALGWAAVRTDYSYRRPGRRRIPGVVTPAMQQPVIRVAVLIDTSASMSPAQLAAALSEVTGVVRAAGIGSRRITVLTCDATVSNTVQVDAGSVASIELLGGGGTDMRIGIQGAEQLRPAPDVLVVLTDGFTPWPDASPRARLVVGLTGEAADPESVPAYATAVTIPTSV